MTSYPTDKRATSLDGPQESKMSDVNWGMHMTPTIMLALAVGIIIALRFGGKDGG